jgi:hypothetical protein
VPEIRHAVVAVLKLRELSLRGMYVEFFGAYEENFLANDFQVTKIDPSRPKS